MLKDLKLAMAAAEQVGVELEMGEEAEEEFQKFVDAGGGNKDFSAIIKMIDGSWTAPK
jgi:3-hydroxyisobutyrate dehydrogenase